MSNMFAEGGGWGGGVTRMHWECKTELQIAVFISQCYQAFMTILEMDYPRI